MGLPDFSAAISAVVDLRNLIVVESDGSRSADGEFCEARKIRGFVCPDGAAKRVGAFCIQNGISAERYFENVPFFARAFPNEGSANFGPHLLRAIWLAPKALYREHPSLSSRSRYIAADKQFLKEPKQHFVQAHNTASKMSGNKQGKMVSSRQATPSRDPGTHPLANTFLRRPVTYVLLWQFINCNSSHVYFLPYSHNLSLQINWRMKVTLNDGRQMTGQMLAFDKVTHDPRHFF